MPEHQWVGPLEIILVKCFILALITSGAVQGRQDVFPPWRIYFATMAYTGFSAIGLGYFIIHAYGIQYTDFLYGTSVCTGLVSTKVLVALQEQVLISAINWVWTKFTNKELIDSPANRHLIIPPKAEKEGPNDVLNP